jgi:hypothetical protein
VVVNQPIRGARWSFRAGPSLLVPVRYGFGALARAIGTGSPGVTIDER